VRFYDIAGPLTATVHVSVTKGTSVTTPNPPQPGPQQPYPGTPWQAGGPQPQSHPGPGPQQGYPGPGGPQQPQGYPGPGPQPQRPGGQPQYPGGQQPHPAGQPPQQGYPPAPPQYPAEPPKRKSPARRIVLSVVGVGAVLVIGLVARQVTGDPDTASVGECMSGASAQDLKVVECTDSTAEYKVVGKVGDKTQTEASISGEQICRPYAGAERIFWKGEQGGSGYVLCLAPNN
jgi:hypothetical protein